MGSVWNDFFHYPLYLCQLVHKTFLVMQASGGIDNNHIDIVRHRRLKRIVCDSGGIGTKLLLDDRNTGTPSPLVKLLDGSSTECVGGAKHDFIAGLFIKISKFAYSGCLANAVDTYNHYHVWLFTLGNRKIGKRLVAGILGKQLCDLLAEHFAQFIHIDIFVAGHTALYAVDDLESRFRSHIRCYEDFLEFVKEIIVDGTPAGQCPAELAEYAFFRFLQSAVEGLLFLFAEKIKKSHG